MRRSTVLSLPTSEYSLFQDPEHWRLGCDGRTPGLYRRLHLHQVLRLLLGRQDEGEGLAPGVIFLLFFVNDAGGAPPGARMLVARTRVRPHLYWCATSPHYMSTSKLGPAYAVCPHCTGYTTNTPTPGTNDLGLNQGSLTEGEGSVQLDSLS